MTTILTHPAAAVDFQFFKNSEKLGRAVLLLLLLFLAMPVFSQTTWDGSASTDWDNPDNWSAGIPDAGDVVTIPNEANDPEISGAANANIVNVAAGAVLTLNTGGSLALVNLTNSGTVENDGSISLTNASPIFVRINNKTGSVFNNSGTIVCGTSGSARATRGIVNQGTFSNLAGSISMDKLGYGIESSGTFTNNDLITIGSSLDSFAIIASGSFLNTPCSALIDILATNNDPQNISGFSSFNNAGGIIVRSIRSSFISSNSGVIQNLGTGFFGITTNTGTLTAETGDIWMGCTSTDWHEASNWLDRSAPTATDNTMILNRPNDPEITTSVEAKRAFVNGGMLTIAATGVLTINASPLAGIFNAGTVSNAGEIWIGNLSTIGTAGIQNNGTFQNSGLIDINRTTGAGLLNGQATANFQNSGQIHIGLSASVGNYGLSNQVSATFSNLACGEILTNYPIFVGVGTLTNNGLFKINTASAHAANAALINNGILEYPQGNQISGVTNNEIIAAPISGGCSISPALSLGATVDFDIAANWFLDENLTQPAGTFNQATNTFSNSNVPSGTPTTVYFEIEDAAGGCTRVVSVKITSTCCVSPTCNITGADYVCSNSSDNIYSAPAGMASYSWSISGSGSIVGSSSGQTVSVTAGDFIQDFTLSVTITDAKGCTNSCSKQSFIFYLSPNATITANPNPVTFGSTLDLSVNVPSSSTVSWSGEGISNPSGNPSTTAMPTTTGMHTYFVTVTNDAANGSCSNSGSVDVMVLDGCSGVTAEITGDEEFCASPGNFVTLTASISTTADTYLWDDGSTDATRDVSQIGAVNYSVTVTDTDGCTATAEFVVTGLALPTPAITGINSICSGQNTTLTATGGGDYEWSTGELDNQIETPDLTTSTTYLVTITAANGCTASVAKTVFVKNLPVVNITGATTLCEGQNTKLTATLFNSTYLWDPTGATTSSITVAPLVTTAYTVTLTSNTTGCSNTGSVTVNLTGPCTCESNNMFTNPGFESGKTGWTTTGSVLVTSVAADVHGGTKALKMCNTAGAGYQRKAALPQQSFTFSGWAKGSGTNNKYVGVQFLGANLTVLQETNQNINSTNYQQFSFVVTAPEGTKWVKVNFNNGSGSGCLFVDDFCLVQTVLSLPKNGWQLQAGVHEEFDIFEKENLERIASSSPLYLFPNPTADVLNLIFSNQEKAFAGQIEVFNSMGQRVLTQNLNVEVGEEGVLSVGHLPEGAYFLLFRNADGSTIGKHFSKIW